MKILIATCSFCMASASLAAEAVQVCKLGAKASSRVELIRDDPVASTHIYYLQYAGQRTPLFGTKALSRGADVAAQCVGTRQRALILSGEFTANALQGVALTNNPRTHKIARLDFAEKDRPRWLYLGPQHLMVVVPSSGYGESDARYTLYRHRFSGKGHDRVMHVPELPPTTGSEIIDLTTVVRRHQPD